MRISYTLASNWKIVWATNNQLLKVVILSVGLSPLLAGFSSFMILWLSAVSSFMLIAGAVLIMYVPGRLWARWDPAGLNGCKGRICWLEFQHNRLLLKDVEAEFSIHFTCTPFMCDDGFLVWCWEIRIWSNSLVRRKNWSACMHFHFACEYMVLFQ